MTLEFRPTTEHDAAAVAELLNAFENAVADYPEPTSEEDVLLWWRREGEGRLVLDGEMLVGLAYLQRRGDRWDGDGFVHPDAFGRGVGTAIVQWLEQRARELGSPEIRIAVLGEDPPAACLMRARGYARMRTFFRMAIELAEEPGEAAWPDGYEVSTLRPGEERDLYQVLEDAFADHWDHNERTYEEWIAVRKIDHELCFLVRSGGEVAAGELCRLDDFGTGWVDVLGTRREHRRRGLGEALLAQAFRVFYGRGTRRVGLGVDSESLTGATRLYERVGMRVASRIDLYAKEL